MMAGMMVAAVEKAIQSVDGWGRPGAVVQISLKSTSYCSNEGGGHGQNGRTHAYEHLHLNSCT